MKYTMFKCRDCGWTVRSQTGEFLSPCFRCNGVMMLDVETVLQRKFKCTHRRKTKKED